MVYSDNVSVGGLLQIKGPSVFPQYEFYSVKLTYIFE